MSQTIPGPVPAFGNYIYTFPGSIDMSSTGTYNLSITTSLSTDTFAANNVLSETRFSNSPIASYPYTADFNTDNEGWVSRTTDATRLFIHDSIPYLSGPQGNGKSWYLSASLQECCTDVWVESQYSICNGLSKSHSEHGH